MQIIEGMSNAEYQQHPSVSKSVLDMAAFDLYKPEWSRNCPQDSSSIATFDFGDAMHAICLEPDRLESEFVVEPNVNKRTNAGKAELAEFVEANKGKKILTFDQHKQLRLMFESVMAHPQSRAIIESEGQAEASVFWTDDQTGLDCRCRPDKVLPDLRLVDIKTTPDLGKFCYAVEDYRYHVQNAWYCDGMRAVTDDPYRMEFLVIQKTIEIGRYPVMVCRLPSEAVEYGRKVYREDLERYAEFLSRKKLILPSEELQMHYRFVDNAMEKLSEVTL